MELASGWNRTNGKQAQLVLNSFQFRREVKRSGLNHSKENLKVQQTTHRSGLACVALQLLERHSI